MKERNGLFCPYVPVILAECTIRTRRRKLGPAHFPRSSTHRLAYSNLHNSAADHSLIHSANTLHFRRPYKFKSLRISVTHFPVPLVSTSNTCHILHRLIVCIKLPPSSCAVMDYQCIRSLPNTFANPQPLWPHESVTVTSDGGRQSESL